MASGGEVNVVFFMEEVQKYDCLYNKYSKSYKDKYIKINCWTKIGEKFDMSAADAEKKFKNVRTGYGRYLKKVKVIPSNYLLFSFFPALYCSKYKHNACLKLQYAKSFVRMRCHFEYSANFALKCCHSPKALLPS